MINGILEMLIKRSRTAPEPPGPSIPTDYVFYAPLSNDVNDHSSSARTGTIDGTDAGSVIIGDVKDDVKCTYLPQSVRLLYPLEDVGIGGSPRTFSIWVYPSNTKWDTNTFMAVGTAAANKVFAYGCKNYKYNFTAYANDINTSTNVTLAWHNLVVTYSGTMVVIYLDGVEIGSKSTSSIDTGSSDISIGGRPAYNAGEQCENAWFAAARIYNRVLDEDEIALLANEDLTGDTSDSSSSGWSDSSSSGGAEPSDSSSSAPTPAGPTDYVFRAPLANDLNDVSASARTGTAAGGTATTGEVKDGVACTYIPQAVKVTWPIGDVALGSSPRTVSLWFWTPSITSSWNTMFSYGSNSDHYKLYAMGYHQSGKYAFTAYYNDLDSGLGTATASTWHNFVTTYDGTDIKVYVDGVLKGSKTTSDIDTATSDITVGGRSYNSDYAGDMWYADIRIYNRALTDAEIVAIASKIN